MKTALLNNRYRILQTLGRGGFGETFLAEDTHMPSARKCALKQLKPAVESAGTQQWVQERFRREAAILEELGEGHPQIPRLYAYFSEDGTFYLVQEWIEGVTLRQKQEAEGNLPEEEVREILVNLLPVLDYIHSRRILHRDIKPENIILRASDSKPVLIDFGAVKEAIATVVYSNGNTPFSVAIGTPGYMASEQAAGRPIYSSDLYSLGLTAVYLLMGKAPETLETDPRTGEILWRKQVPQLHSNLAAVIDRAIRFHPRDRFSSAKEMLEALQSPASQPTSATLVVSPRNSSSTRSQVSKRPTVKAVTTSAPSVTLTSSSSEVEQGSGWLRWIVSILLIGGVTAGGFAIGFNLFTGRAPFSQPKEEFSPKEFPQTEPKKPETPVIPEPQSPSIRQRETLPKATPSPSPATPEASPSSSPETLPEATPSPSPEIPEASPSPSPQSPEPTAVPSPGTPKASPLPSPQAPVAIPVPPPETPPVTSMPSPPAPPAPAKTDAN